jgi:hypothetical protein
MRKVTIAEIKQRAVVYEKTAPLDGQLRNALQIGGLCTLLAIPISLFFMPVLSGWAFNGFFWFMGDFAVGLLWLLRSPVGLVINGLALVGYGVLLVQTKGLEAEARVHLAWHRLAFGLAVVGAVNLFIMGLPALGVVVNIVIWIVIFTLAIALAMAILLGAAVRR